MARSKSEQEARVLAKYAELYADLDKFRWYNIRPGKFDHNGGCWLVAYGVKKYVKCAHFEIRNTARQRVTS